MRLAPTEEAALVKRCRTGEEEAFRLLVRQYGPYIGHIAFQFVRDPESVADVVQEVFLRVVRRLHTLRQPERLRAWLSLLARNAALDLVRRRIRRRRIDAHRECDVGISLDEIETAEPDDAYGDAAVSVREWIRELPEAYRRVLVLRHLEGLPNGEVARTLGISAQAVHSRAYRARKLLRLRMRRTRESASLVL